MSRTFGPAVAILLCATFVGGLVSAQSPSTASFSNTRASATSRWLAGWPMVGHDPQRTDRSPDRVSLPLRLLWVHKGFFAPIIGADGSVTGWGSGGLMRLGAAGQARWLYAASPDGPPALSSDGRIGAVSQPVGGGGPDQTSALVLQPSGTLETSERGVGFSKGAAPLSCPDGALSLPIVGPSEVQRVYGGVLVFRPGQAHPIVLLPHLGVDALARQCGGTIYAIVSDSTGSTSLVAVTPAGHILWRRPDPSSNGTLSTVLAGERNTVYVAGGSSIVAYGANGRRHWEYTKADGALALSEAPGGYLLAAGASWLDALAPDGKRLWRVRVGSSSSAMTSPALAVDAAGKAFVASGDGQVDIISTRGKQLARMFVSPHARYPQSPSIEIGPGGSLLVLDSAGDLRMYGH